MTYALLITLGAGALATLVQSLRLRGAVADAVLAKSEAAAMQVRLDLAVARARSAEDVSVELGRRLDAVTIDYRRQIAELEADIATCSTPDATRARLSSFFGGPKP